MRKRNIYVAYGRPNSAVGASKLHFDFWNGHASLRARILQLRFMNELDVAVVGALAVRMDIARSTTIGTTGTAFAAEDVLANVRSIFRPDPLTDALPAGISMREAPGGGAAAGAYLGSLYAFPEETGDAAYASANQDDYANFGDPAVRIVVPPGGGLRFDQGAVASVGKVGVRMVFELV